jgi:DNA repair protein RecN (Recombination protein N)
MLKALRVRDLAIVRSVELELGPGLTVLSGETGAGKSILVGALGLALGARAGPDWLRGGADRGEVEAVFAPPAGLLSHRSELDLDGEVVLRRVLHREGRSRAFVGDTPVAASVLRSLGRQLLDYAGQHEHRVLLDEGAHLGLVDASGGPELERARAACRSAWAELSKLSAEQRRLRRAAEDRDARSDYLRFQISELEALAPRRGEEAELAAASLRLANAGRLGEGLRAALTAVDQEERGAAAQLWKAQRALEALLRYDAELAELQQRLAGTVIELEDLVAEIGARARRIEDDPAQLQDLEDRRAALRAAGRKHRCDPDQLPERLAELRDQLAELDEADLRIQDLDAELEAAARVLVERARALRQVRGRAARALERAVNPVLGELAMPGARLTVAMEELEEGGLDTGDPELPHIAELGADRLRFLLTANPGEPARALSSAASGGELARVLLALKGALRGTDRVPTLIFDEIDAGIGGRTADAVGARLAQLAADHQVLVITHLPRIAVRAHAHIAIRKETSQGRVTTGARVLDRHGRIDELARMIGEGEEPAAARALAERWMDGGP